MNFLVPVNIILFYPKEFLFSLKMMHTHRGRIMTYKQTYFTEVSNMVACLTLTFILQKVFNSVLFRCLHCDKRP